MGRLTLLLIILVAAALLASCKTTVPIGGAEGLSLLKSMANITSNLTEDNKAGANLTSANNTTINLSHAPLSAELSGTDGEEVLDGLIKASPNLTGTNYTEGDLSTWGSKPRDSPPPPSAAAYKLAKFIKIIRDNHIA